MRPYVFTMRRRALSSVTPYFGYDAIPQGSSQPQPSGERPSDTSRGLFCVKRLGPILHLNLTLTLALLLALSVASLGCSGPPKNLIKPGAAIPGLNLTGGYDCKQFGFMQLKHNARSRTVRGTYEGVRIDGSGRIQGRIEGDLVWFDWIQPGNPDSAILPARGKGWLRISNRGAQHAGKWGYDQSKDDGGEMALERSQYYDK